MSWEYIYFPCHPDAAEWYKMRVRDTIIFYHHYRVDPNIGKGVCTILWIICVCPGFVSQLDK